MIVPCSHCGKDIDTTGDIRARLVVYWCLDCLREDYTILNACLGATFWTPERIRTTRVGFLGWTHDWLERITNIPKLKKKYAIRRLKCLRKKI